MQATLHRIKKQHHRYVEKYTVKDETVQHVKGSTHAGDPVTGIFDIAHPLDCGFSQIAEETAQTQQQ